MRNGIPNLTALQAFEASARLGSFSRAAEELSLTHSAVYRQVASLEARLGVQLFTRVRRRIVLTDHGAEYAGRIRHRNSIWRRNDTAVGSAWRCAKSANCCTARASQRVPPRMATGFLASAKSFSRSASWPAVGADSINS